MWLQGEAELRCSAVELLDDAVTILLLVVISSWVAIIHTVAHGVIEENGDLASGRGDGLGVTDTAGKAAIKCAESSVAAAYGHCRKTKRYRYTTTGLSSVRRQDFSATDACTWP